MKKVLAIQLPAPCGFACPNCRFKNHNDGDPDKLFLTLERKIVSEHYDEVYITSNGETGRSVIFNKTISLLKSYKIPISVLCASQVSIVPGLKRVEISIHHSILTVEEAIVKAKSFDIPIILSVIDDELSPIDCKSLVDRFGVEGILVRALQNEGRSIKSAGKSEYYVAETCSRDIGVFPVVAYKELLEFGRSVECLDEYGNNVKLLGSPAAA